MADNGPSDLFCQIFVTGGAAVTECAACSRTHFSREARWDWEPGEYERLQQLAAAQPDRYVEHADDDSVATAVGGQVLDCPCAWAERAEAFLLAHADKITEFLYRWARPRAEAIAKETFQAASALEAVQGLRVLQDERSRRARDAYEALTGDTNVEPF